jgi:hypothetical protein
MHVSAHRGVTLISDLGSDQFGLGVVVGIVIIQPSAGGVHG